MLRLTLALLALIVISCGKQEPARPIVEYPMRGEVVRLDPASSLATVKHEEIKGWMGAMTMEYTFRDKADFAKLKPGLKFDATVFVQGDDYWVGRVKPLD